VKHQHPLDSLRGILAVIVVSAHAWQIFGVPAGLEGAGWIATVTGLAARVSVLAFFTLSGYVIAASVAANVAAHGSFRADQFALARAFRISVPLVAVILMTVVLEAMLRALDATTATAPEAARKTFRTDPLGQLRALYTLCVRGELTGAWLNGPLWSLTYEIRLYVVSGLLAVVLCGSGWIGRAAAGILLYVYLSAIDAFGSAVDLQKVSFAAFLCGAIAYRFRQAPTRYLLGVAMLALTAAAARLLAVRGSVVEGLDKDPLVLAAQVAAFIAFAIAVVLIGRGPAWRVLQGAGSYSYTLYIGHFPLLLAAYFACENFARGLLGLAVVVFTAIAAFFLTWMILARAGLWLEGPHQQREASEAVLHRLKRASSRVMPTAVLALLCLAPAEAPASKELPAISTTGDSSAHHAPGDALAVRVDMQIAYN
jgi:peptidoglycan/LPS O-acetylase OafA/YrhL